MDSINDAIVSLLAGDEIDSESLRSFLDANPALGLIIVNLISQSIDAGEPTPTLADVAEFLGDNGFEDEGLFFSGLFDVDAGFPLDGGSGDNAQFVGLTDNNQLVTFAADMPEAIRQVKVNGIEGILLGIDVRPADGKIYGLTTANQIYRLDLSAVDSESLSSTATLVSTLDIPFGGGTISGFDFNPAADRLRLVGDNDQDFRINVDTGAVIVDGPLAFAEGDANAGVNPNITAAAYTNSFNGTTSTQLYDIDTLLNQLVLQNPPNDGTLMTVGDLGVDFDTLGGFDILSDGMGGNAAFAVSNATLYSIDLETGGAISLGRVGDDAQLNIQGLTVITAMDDGGMDDMDMSDSGEDDDGIEVGSDANEIIANALFEGNADNGVDIEGDNSNVTIKEISSTGNTEEGVAIDGSFNTVSIMNASFTGNGDDGFDILGVGNSVQWESVSSSGNAEEGFKIDGQNNSVVLNSASFTNNSEDGFEIDMIGIGNRITISNVAFQDNGDDGFDVFGTANSITWSHVSSIGNTEEGFEIDGNDNLVTISNSSLSGNGADGFKIGEEGVGNIVNFSNSTFSNNVDGFDINGSDNLISLFQVGISDNSGTAVEVEGDNNTVTISSSTFSNNREFALLVEGSNNRITISDSAFMGSGNGILDTGSNNIITVLNSTGLGEIVISDSSTLII